MWSLTRCTSKGVDNPKLGRVERWAPGPLGQERAWSLTKTPPPTTWVTVSKLIAVGQTVLAYVRRSAGKWDPDLASCLSQSFKVTDSECKSPCCPVNHPCYVRREPPLRGGHIGWPATSRTIVITWLIDNVKRRWRHPGSACECRRNWPCPIRRLKTPLLFYATFTMTDTLLRHWLLTFSKTRKRVLTSFLYLLIVFLSTKTSVSAG